MEKRKLSIKIITCHDVYNIGASLQAFALSSYLKKLGHQVEIIDYKPYYLKHYELWGVRNPRYNKPILKEIYNILKFPGRLNERRSKRKKAFDNFTRTYLPVTDKMYNSNEELMQDNIEADVFFAGSDQIWNTIFQNGRDPAFYIAFAPIGSICASYAASFATEDIVEEYKEKVALWISKLNFVSVREKSGLDILQNLGISEVHKVVDPVFLLTRKEWECLLDKSIVNEKYLLMYDFDNNENLNNKAIELAKEKGWEIYSVFPNAICDKCFYDAGPIKFISLVKHSQMVLSNSFHATAFSIIFEKQFIVYDRKEKINTRMRDMLESLNVSMDEQYIEYRNVNTLLEKQIEISKEYINLVLSAVRKE